MKIDRSGYEKKRQQLLDAVAKSEESFASLLKLADPVLKLFEKAPAGSVHLELAARLYQTPLSYDIHEIRLGTSASGGQAQLLIAGTSSRQCLLLSRDVLKRMCALIKKPQEAPLIIATKDTLDKSSLGDQMVLAVAYMVLGQR